MIKYPTIIKYLTLKFLGYLFLVSFVIITILFVSSAFDILQKFKSVYVPPKDFWSLIFLKIPLLYNEISGIIGFISTILFIRHIISSNELLIINASGIPLWHVFAVPIVTSFMFGVIIIAIINPISAFGLKESNRIEVRLNNTLPDDFVISQSGIFFYERYQDTNRIIQAKSINQDQKKILNITIFIVSLKNELLERIDSPLAILEGGQFKLLTPNIYSSNKHHLQEKMFLPTNLSINNLILKFMPPEMIIVWNLPKLINEISNSGLPILKYQIYFYKQLFKPITMAAMVLIACWFLNLNNRKCSNYKNLIFALVIGLVIYFLLEITIRILSYGGVEPLIATLLPILFVILISNFVILHFQEA